MKKLIILRGIPGSGKSTFIKDNNLQDYTLSPDTFRVMLSSHSLNNEGKLQVSQQESKKAWELTFEFLEARMKHDLLTVIDATHCNQGDLSKYLKLTNLYHYKIYVIDFEASLEEAFERNEVRDDSKKVPQNIIEKFHNNLAIAKKTNLPTEFKLLEKSKWKEEILREYHFDASEYENVYTISDLQGTHQPVKDFFGNHVYSKRNLYIFVGDYVDRGIENDLSVKFILNNQKANFIYLLGNHEYHLHCWANNLTIRSSDFRNHTKPQLEEAGISKESVHKVIKKMKEFVIVKNGDKEILISHCGLTFYPSADDLLFMQGHELTYKKEYTFPIDSTFEENTQNHQYQFHGHRNPEGRSLESNMRSIPLEENVEHGGYLRVAKIDKDGAISFERYKNNIVRNKVESSLVTSLSESHLVNEKKLQDGIYSYNFTREAFYKRDWEELTTKARGLFIHKESETIVARSYDKFFNVGEFDHCSLESLKKMKFPVDVFLKDNGFLGILGYNPLKRELLFCSKSTNTGDFAGYFRTIFDKNHKDQTSRVTDYLKDNNCSMVFEVIDTVNDPHIIEYDRDQVVLLDIIDNTSEFKHVSYIKLCLVAAQFGFKVKERTKTIANYEEFLDFYAQVTDKSYLYDDISPVEGFVIEDYRGYMVKIKCHYYSYWKGFRNIINAMTKGKYANPEEIDKLGKFDDEAKSVLKFVFKEKLFNKNNIDIQKAYLKDRYLSKVLIIK